MDYRKWAKYPDWHPVHPANRKQDKTKLTLNDNGNLN